jgi:hypothetical protein
LLTSVSVIVFFRRNRVDTRPWNTLIAPALGAAAILGAIVLIVANFTTLISRDASTATWLIGAIPVVLVLGAGLTRFRRV